MNIIDCDVHVRWGGLEEIAAFLQEPWRARLVKGRIVHPHNNFPNPIATARRDAMPPNGGSPGSDPQFTLEDHVDKDQIAYAVLFGESTHLTLSNMPNPDAAAALASAYNDWLIERWLKCDARFLGSIFVATQDPALAALEIKRVGSHPQMVQVQIGSGQRFLLGQRHYYPIYAAAQEQQLPVAIHPFNEGSGTAPAPTGSGYPSHYLEFHTACILNMQAHLVSLIYEGVFERFPNLVFVFVEGGVGWLPTLLWRLDREWKSLRIEVPWVKRKPSEYVAEHVRFTTQPLDEPDSLAHLHQLFDMFPAGEVLLFSTDYPHWDYDRPAYVAARLPSRIRERVMSENARALYNLK